MFIWDCLWTKRPVIHQWQEVTMHDKKWQRVVQLVTKNDNEFKQMTTSVTTNGTTSDNEW